MVMGENCIKLIKLNKLNVNDCSHKHLCSVTTRKELMRVNFCERQTETDAVQQTTREGRAV